MYQGQFVWTDLSSYDLGAARSDYAALFGWSIERGGSYDMARIAGQDVAALFTMPAPLAKIDMPSFWMSYVATGDLDGTVAKAMAQDGAILEVAPQAFNGDARIALIRDPAGAGFTLYEGPDIASPTGAAGQVMGRYHHSKDIQLIAAFYGDLFGWRFVPRATTPWPVYDIVHPGGAVIAQAEEVPPDVRGKFSYWMPSFGVASLEQAQAALAERGGTALSALGRTRALVADRQGAHFIFETL
ncbi:MAG: VOC family protein [Pseudomonadota bacterium]